MLENFIKSCIKIHNNKYDYSLVNYVNARTKVKIICPIHGVFEQTPENHKNRKQGCPKCAKKYKYNSDEIIEKFNIVHNNKYDYSLVNYVNAKTKIKMICPIHGVFEQRVDHHLNGKGCLKCNNLHKKSNEDFKKISNIIHNNKYDYSLVEYKNNHTKVKIICPIHGVFEQKPLNHINKKQGCPKCVGKNKTNNDFILESIKINGNKYDYTQTHYKNNHTKVKIICPIHGVFEQLPNNHLTKNHGCPICNESHGEKIIRMFLENFKIDYIKQKKFENCKFKRQLPFDFYLPDYNICIEYDGIQHFEPIEIFGGIEKFKEIKELDTIKTNYCRNNDINLFRIKYDDNIIDKLWELIIHI